MKYIFKMHRFFFFFHDHHSQIDHGYFFNVFVAVSFQAHGNALPFTHMMKTAFILIAHNHNMFIRSYGTYAMNHTIHYKQWADKYASKKVVKISMIIYHLL